MKRRTLLVLLALIALLLAACRQAPKPSEPTEPLQTQQTLSSQQETTAPESTQTETTEPAETNWETVEPAVTEPEVTEPEVTEPIAIEPEHSSLYIPGVSQEDMNRYFNEVCLDSEFVYSGDPSIIQKWVTPICYTLEGDYTDADVAAVNALVDWLNTVDGFPGMFQVTDPLDRNLRICFGDQQEMLDVMGQNYTGLDGAVTYWYMNNEIYDAVIFCRSDVDQTTRSSVILEEIYNGLGPIQDTALRPDSIIYQYYSQPQWLTAVDELILRLLYHPDIRPGMNAQQCAQIINRLYY